MGFKAFPGTNSSLVQFNSFNSLTHLFSTTRFSQLPPPPPVIDNDLRHKRAKCPLYLQVLLELHVFNLQCCLEQIFLRNLGGP